MVVVVPGLQAFPSLAVLRRHAAPPPRQFEPLLRAAAAAGIDIDISNSKVTTALLVSRLVPGDERGRE